MGNAKTPTLADLVKDTPEKSMTPLDAHLSAFLASTPPPAMADATAKVLDRYREQTPSGIHDLEELQKQMLQAYQRDLDARRRVDMLKPLYWPTAVVVAVFVAGYFVLLAMGRSVPAPVMAVVAAIGTIIAGIAPKLLSGTGGAS